MPGSSYQASGLPGRPTGHVVEPTVAALSARPVPLPDPRAPDTFAARSRALSAPGRAIGQVEGGLHGASEGVIVAGKEAEP
jgi:hypothetical protein